MITIQKVINTRIMPSEERIVAEFAGLSTDEKPTEFANKTVDNGSVYLEIDTGKLYMYDLENQKWYEKKNSGGSGANIEPSKSVEYTENGDYTISPSSGYDGIEGASVSVNVPTSVNNETQSVSITQNGETTYTPTSGYTGIGSITVDVNVSGGGAGIDLTSRMKFGHSEFSTIPSGILNANWEDITDMDYMFYNTAITSVPTIGTTSIVSMQYAFSNCYSLETVNTNNTANVIYMTSIFENDNMLENIPELDTSSCVNMQNAFLNCQSLTNTSLNNILGMCANVSSNYMRPKALKDIGLDDTQIATCQTLSNYQDAVDAGWTDYIEVTVDVDLTTIRAASPSDTYTVPTLGAFDTYLYNYNVTCILNDNNLSEQVVGTIEWNHFESTDGTLSFDINYNSDEHGNNEYYFENISYNPQI